MSDSRGDASVCRGVKWGMWYHCGTVAFGAFIIALVTILKIIFEYFARKAEMANPNNPMAKAIICCARCAVWCLDQYVKYVTKNAFIQSALKNTNFCSSAWTSFYLMVRHAGRFSSATMIGWIMMLLGKGVIMGSTSYLTFLLVKETTPEVK